MINTILYVSTIFNIHNSIVGDRPIYSIIRGDFALLLWRFVLISSLFFPAASFFPIVQPVAASQYFSDAQSRCCTIIDSKEHVAKDSIILYSISEICQSVPQERVLGCAENISQSQSDATSDHQEFDRELLELKAALQSNNATTMNIAINSVIKKGESAAPLLPILLELAVDPESPYQTNAIKAIGSIGDKRTVDFLCFIYRKNAGSDLAASAVLDSLANFGPEGRHTFYAMIHILVSGYLNFELHDFAIHQLVMIGESALPDLIALSLDNRIETEARLAIMSIIRINANYLRVHKFELPAKLIRNLNDPKCTIRERVCDILGWCTSERAWLIPYLEKMYTDRDPRVRLEAAKAVVCLDKSNTGAIQILVRHMTAEQAEVRGIAVSKMKYATISPTSLAFNALVERLDDPDDDVCSLALSTISHLSHNTPQLREKLRLLANNHLNLNIRTKARYLLKSRP